MEPEKPPWLRIRAPTDPRFLEMRRMVRERELSTVCTASRCPNMGECWTSGNATFMILGETCTRNCPFCAVPSGQGEEVDMSECGRIAELVGYLGLGHVVVTSVTRDDLPDGGPLSSPL
jgi:lipoic acid synthetase